MMHLFVLTVGSYCDDGWAQALCSSILLCAGSIPERDEGKLYNTCCVFGPGGDMIGKYRKASIIPGWVSIVGRCWI